MNTITIADYVHELEQYYRDQGIGVERKDGGWSISTPELIPPELLLMVGAFVAVPVFVKGNDLEVRISLAGVPGWAGIVIGWRLAGNRMVIVDDRESRVVGHFGPLG